MGDDGVTRLLVRMQAGDTDAEEALIALLEADFRRMAHAQMRREKRAVTLNTTVLVNEAYLRLKRDGGPWNSRRHYYAAAAEAMRRIRVESARARKRLKRGGGATPLSLEEAERAGAAPAAPVEPAADGELLGVDEHLARLAADYPRQAEVVRLRFFLNLSIDEIAEVLGVSPRTVDSDWRLARSWFSRVLGAER